MRIFHVVIAGVTTLVPYQAAGEEIGEPDFEVSESYYPLEKLAELRDEPLDVNRVSRSELLAIPWITPLLAEEIVAWRRKSRSFVSLDDLKSLPGMTDELFHRVRPYMRVGEGERREEPYPVGLLLRSRVLDSRPISGGYLGSSRKVYNRFRISLDEKLSTGFLAEKDSYERSYSDFFCGYLSLQDLKCADQVVLGSYQLDLGEGLLFSGPRFTLKSSGIVKGSEKGLEPYASSDENSSLFGVALGVRLGGIELLPFYSRSRLDATLDESGRVESLYESGYHRTESELDKADRVTEELLGGRIALHGSDGFKIGITSCRGRYDPVFSPGEEGYYKFSGDGYSLLGADFDLLFQGVEFFGEYAKSLGLGAGALLGSTFGLPPVELSVVFRKYDDDFYSPHSSGFADRKDQNESGAFGGMGYKLSRSTKFRGYVDLFEQPRPAYRTSFPVSARETFGEVEHSLLDDLTLRLRYRSKGKEESTQTGNGSKLLLHRTENYRIQADWEESKELSLRVRTELSRSEIPDLGCREGGGLLLVGVVSKPVDALRIEGRFIYFGTDSYDSRIYEYENDLPGVMRNQALYGKGRRAYLLIRESLTRSSKVSLKWGFTSKEGEATRTEYGLQLDVRL